MNCIQNGIKLCPVCEDEVANDSFKPPNCWMIEYSEYIKTHSKNEVKLYFLKIYENSSKLYYPHYLPWTFWFRKTIELYHPEYKEIINDTERLMVLK